MASDPGARFNYSSGNTHLLSAVLQAASGTGTCELARRHLLGEIGVAPEHWGRDPQGVDSGGYNVYMTAREMARFGLLYLNGGEWDGRRVVPRSTVAAAGGKVWRVGPRLGYSQGW